MHVANSTGTGLEQPATGRNARPKRNLTIPAAVDPARPRKVHVTAAVTGHGASNPKAGIVQEYRLLNRFMVAMGSHPKIVDLLKDYMDADDQSEHGIMAQEFRTCFRLKKSCSPVISGYFQRIYRNPTFLGHYRVVKTQQVRDPDPVPYCPKVH